MLRWGGKNTQNNYTKKVLMTQITTMVWSFTWSQESWSVRSGEPWETSLWIKLVEVMEFQLSYFILKDDVVKGLHSVCQHIWKTQQWPWDWKMSAFIPISKKGNAIGCLNYHTIALVTHASKVMLKILQARLQQYMKWELPDVQAGFRKGRGTRDQTANIHRIIEKAREFFF